MKRSKGIVSWRGWKESSISKSSEVGIKVLWRVLEAGWWQGFLCDERLRVPTKLETDPPLLEGSHGREDNHPSMIGNGDPYPPSPWPCQGLTLE